MNYQDQGLVERLIADRAESQRKSVEIYSEDFIFELEDKVEKYSFGANLAEQMPSASRFIKDPNKIKVHVVFPKPVRFGRLDELSFKQAINILKTADFSITAN